MFTGQMHTDFPRALYEIGEDRDNRVLVLTGTGDRFMTEIDGQSRSGNQGFFQNGPCCLLPASPSVSPRPSR